tara:strand:+ start:9794 stop:10144 length:351 start_codon:yes stop_codon:yes gene_type:complete
METVFIYIFGVLSGATAITDLVPTAKIFPVLAPQDTAGDFIVFNVSRESVLTKNGLSDYRVGIYGYLTDGLEAVRMADIIEGVLSADRKFKLGSAEIEYQDSMQKCELKLILTFKN